MSSDRFQSWEEETDNEIKAVPKAAPPKPAAFSKPSPADFSKPSPADKTPEEIFDSVWSLKAGESVSIEMDPETFNEVYSKFRGPAKSNRPSYDGGELRFTKK